MDEKGQFSFAFIFALSAMILLFVGLMIVPMLQNMGTGLFAGSETMLEQTIESANEINDADVRASVTGAVQETKDSYVTQTEIWMVFSGTIILFIIAVTGLVIYLNGRSSVERQIG